MATDQHFCLRWNNHQSTLISVFDTLLESGTLVDCTLAADGQQLKAHKVVLSACSPYLEALLSQHYDKHPIIILRDVKFPELKAMLDYMYRGEVNITQEQLGTFLKAAESLQIKGLTDSGGGGGGGGGGGESKRHDIRKQLAMPAAITPQSRPRIAGGNDSSRKSGASQIAPHIMDAAPSSPLKAREGSVSPVVKKRRKPDHPMHNNTDEAARLVQTQTTDNGVSPPTDADTLLLTANTTNNNSWPNNKPAAADNTNNTNSSSGKEKSVKNEQCEDLLQPKAEYMDDVNDNDNSADEAALDDDDDEDPANAKMDATSKPGPSHSANTQGYQSWMEDDSSNEESGGNNQQNSQGYGQWHVSTDGSADETMMTAPPQDSQEDADSRLASGGHMLLTPDIYAKLMGTGSTISGGVGGAVRTSVFSTNASAQLGFTCPRCGNAYARPHSLSRHIRFECGVDPKFECPICHKKSKHKHNLMLHMRTHLNR